MTPAGGARVPATGGATLRRVPLAGTGTAPATLEGAARRVPGAHVQTNSRGEALVYLRGAGERQTVVTLDGAPLGPAWDRRADLALVPVWALDGASVATGTPSIAWGPNAPGGTVDLVSRRAGGEGALTEAGVTASTPEAGRIAAAHVRRRGAWGWTLAAEAGATAGEPVAARAHLPFSQTPGALRTNTDRRRASALARIAWTPEASGVSASGGAGVTGAALTLLAASAPGGVAPEAHLDPSRERVRFWRRPRLWQGLAALGVRARTHLWRLRGTAWGAAGAQTIRQYPSAEYAAPEAEQRDGDASAGARLLAELPRAWGVLRVAGFGLVAEHREQERPLTAGAATPEAETFRHATASAGVEAETRGRLRGSGGLALDAMAPLATGLRPGAGPFGDVALHAGAVWDAAPGLTLRAGGGRKTRFPSMRELFGGALGRFALNPDLRPERVWLAETAAEWDRGPLAAGAVLFARDVRGTIEQAVLADGRRQRQNLGGSHALGVEATARWRPASGVALGGALTLVRARSDAGERLAERPAALGRLSADLARGPWSVSLWADGVGGVVSPVPGGRVALPGAVLVGAEAGAQWPLGRAIAELSLRVDNALDASHVPQAGLPAPGRRVALGLRVLR